MDLGDRMVKNMNETRDDGQRAGRGEAEGRQLTPRQRRFVAEYVLDMNATGAARRAGYSRRTAAEQGCRLLRKVKVQAEIAKAQKDRSERQSVYQDFVLQGLVYEAQRLGKEGSPSARVRALGLLAKHLGMFADRPVRG